MMKLRFYSFFLSMLFTVSLSAQTKGDVTKDGHVNITDVVYVINAIAKSSNSSQCDVDGNGKVNISDVVAIINIIAKGTGGGTGDPAVSNGLCPDSNHPHTIDLGLGVKWACCNIGASTPWEKGGYYAWGETKTKSSYYPSNYAYAHKDSNGEFYDIIKDCNYSVNNIGSDISGSSTYDVARVVWKKSWQMPSKSHMEKLIKCSRKWITLNGVEGMRFTGSNGKSIFLPAAGAFFENEPPSDFFSGVYWTSTNYNGKSAPYSMEFSADFAPEIDHMYGYVHGLSVRAITK